MIRFVCLLLAIASLCQTADAQYGYRSSHYAPRYYGNSYSYHSAPYYSGWTYRVYPGTQYHYRVRYLNDSYGQHLEHDGYLYAYVNGCYNQHCAISDFVNKAAVVLVPEAKLAVLGKVDVGFDALKYAAAKTYGPLAASVLPYQYPPNPVDLAALLPPLSSEGAARVEAALKHSSSATEALTAIALGEQEKDKRDSEGRKQILLAATKLQAVERILGKVNEMSLAEMSVNASENFANVQIGDPLLAQLVSTSCFNCHGGAKTEGGLDFKRAASFSTERDGEWKKIVRAVQRGTMPKGGQPLTDDQVSLFENHYDHLRLAAK